MKLITLILLLAFQLLPLAAQEKSDTAFVFRFASGKDVFYVPFKENETELQRLCAVLEANKELLQAGKMYIAVSSYAASVSADLSAVRMAYLRNHRVKSELITRQGLKETHFVTDRQIREPYDGESDVVVVVIPASVEKVAQIAGEQAAATVRTYYREIEQTQEKAINQKQALAEQTAREAAQRAAATTARQAEEERIAEQKAQAEKATADRKRLEAEQAQALLAAEAAHATPYTLALRANLLRWATLTPDLGMEWRINRHVGIVVDGTWSSWSWSNKDRRYALWRVSPAIHYYIGKQKRSYIGAMYHIGEFNYKLSDTGKQGNLQGGGIVGGYQLPIGNCLMLDFNLGIGCTHASYDTYTLTDGVKVRTGNHTKNYWGINKAGVTLVWKLF